ncbi:O-antigen translocase [Undibacterium pigrum]|uniref:PST family polysaccharide transporter n=1 Tax=Undibacterium pigrum TaxID=401470 RepID=A0A318J442_9BURK|nr:O-antigen translocase [Undibacterium pigrum]PXX42528.1 PST family polysaccharide transporter [Undibacterium pigrum]
MTLVRTSLLNAIAVMVRMLTMLGLNKLLAVYVGPGGYAVIGQFQNAVTMILSFASGAISTGVTKYTAEHGDDETAQHKVWASAARISLYCSLATSAVIAVFHQQLAVLLLKNAQYGSVFLWLAASLVLFVLNTLLLAILNGKKAVAAYVGANIATSIVTLLATWWLASVWGLYGALVALAVNQSFVAIITLVLCLRSKWFSLGMLFAKADRDMLRKLGAYALMAIVTATVVPLSQMLIRNQLVQDFGWQQAGYWQAVTRISDIYLMLITTTLTVYYLPRLAEIKAAAELKKEIARVYRFVLPLTALGAVMVYLLRDLMLWLVFTEEFRPMLQLLAWQLVGDFIKIGSWVLGFVMLGRALTTPYVITEIVFSLSLVALTYLLTPAFGLQGAVIAFCINYVLYWACIAWILKKYAYR